MDEDAPVVVDVVLEERYWYPDDGGIVWLAGFQPVDAATGRYLPRDAPELEGRDVLVVNVAGAGRHHADVLDRDAFAPGRRLTLRREPGNEHDPNAISVHDGEGAAQAGWIPREVAAELAPRLDAGERWTALALRERRASPRDPRTGLVALLARAPRIELREHPPR